MAKVTITYEFDYHEEGGELNSVIHHKDICCDLHTVYDAIRGRMKWHDIKDEEYDFLQKLMESLSNALQYVE